MFDAQVMLSTFRNLKSSMISTMNWWTRGELNPFSPTYPGSIISRKYPSSLPKIGISHLAATSPKIRNFAHADACLMLTF